MITNARDHSRRKLQTRSAAPVGDAGVPSVSGDCDVIG
jgi:hypothetical protein